MNTFNFEIFTKYLGVNVPDWVMGSNRACENFTNVFKNGNFLKVNLKIMTEWIILKIDRTQNVRCSKIEH